MASESDPPRGRQDSNVDWGEYRRQVLQDLKDLKEQDERIYNRLDSNDKDHRKEIGDMKVELAVLKTKVGLVAAGTSVFVSALAVIIAEFIKK